MLIRYPYSKDLDFLLEVQKQKIREEFVKIVILDWLEHPIKEIQGVINGGNISINGKSAVRRTCTLNAILTENQFANITDAKNLFSINKKIYLEIGIKNQTDKYTDYDIIWFPQGAYVMQNPNLSDSLSGLTLSMQLKDKMCLLNGECGGTLPASTQFDKYETVNENGELIVTQPTVDQIVREVVNHFGGEQLSKIIVSDIDTKLKAVMRWLGNEPVYLYQNGQSHFLTTDYATASQYQHEMFSYGEDIGFIYTDFVYTSDLIGNAGDSITSILDKIVSYLGGNYEYFYDVEGNFVFQEIKNYLNTTHATTVINAMTNDDYKIDMSKGKAVYNLTDSPIIISLGNAPQYLNIKNDLIVWGIRKTVNGASLPIRYHLAIDKKPEIGNIYDVFFYEDPDDHITRAKMAFDYPNYAAIVANPGKEGVFYKDDSTNKVYIWNGKDYEEIDDDIFIKIKTTDWRSELYLQGVAAEPLGLRSNYYYTELLSEWPKLYNLKETEYKYYGTRSWTNKQITTSYPVGYAGNWTNQLGVASQIGDLLYMNVTSTTDGKMYEYTLRVTTANPTGSGATKATVIAINQILSFSTFNYYTGAFYPEVLNDPSTIDYFLDFIDSEEAISQFSIGNMGRRTIVKNSNDYNCVFEKEVPDYVLIETGTEETASKIAECNNRNQDYILVDSGVYQMLAMGGMHNSCFEEIKNMLWQHTNYNSTISISALPLFNLEPNTRITINSNADGIYGDFMLNSISIPLTINGTMGISATQVQTKL